MNCKEIFKPRFDDFHDCPVVTWRDRGHLQIAENLLEMYLRWKVSKTVKHEPPAAFWESHGPAIVRALVLCGAKALVFAYATDRRVSYQWFGQSPERGDWFHVCSVAAARAGDAGTQVSVTLPTDEEATFVFHSSQMESWLKPKEAPP